MRLECARDLLFEEEVCSIMGDWWDYLSSVHSLAEFSHGINGTLNRRFSKDFIRDFNGKSYYVLFIITINYY